jgi:pyruvate,orthophosphate dikinase
MIIHWSMESAGRALVFDFDSPPTGTDKDRLRLLGGKGANLVVMASELGLPVPPGFIVTTEACRAYLAGEWPAGLARELREHMLRLGERVGRRFGDPADPLLVSVRSGAPVSMPGMMDTVLNLGLSEATAAGLARASSGGADFAGDCLRRFREGYRDVIGTGEVPDDPWLQLRNAVEAVFRSWNSDRARAYRAREGIADDLGTAVTVQAMVFGNRGADSATGVMFTRNPSTGANVPYGDIMFDAQGEDVVAGGHATQPLSALDERLPEVGRQLHEYAAVLERHYADLCDIEFTIEDGRLWLLQVRVGKRSPGAALRMAIDMATDESFPLSRADAVRRVARLLIDPPRVFVRAANSPAPIATGLPASPGLAGGAIVTSSAAAEQSAARGQTVILVREDTSPEDVPGMARSAGVLTARGGLACHAAVVARGWGIPAVVGASSVRLTGDGVGIGERSFRTGERITIDGSTGEVFAGDVPGSWQVAPEAATLLDWAITLGVDVGGAPAADGSRSAAESTTAASSRRVDADEALRTLAIKGTATAEQLADSLLVKPVDVQPLLDGLAADGRLENAAGQWRPTAAGKETAVHLFAADRATLGDAVAGQALEAFHPFDARMKEIVTAWQVREVSGEQQLNDHADPAYDAQVLDSLATLDADVGAWLASLTTPLPRFTTYRRRLSRAAERARTDPRYMASPRVDSYHGAWFELHEDLIRLAGRTREAEAAAGRA